MSLSSIHEILSTTNLRAFELQQGFRRLSDTSNNRGITKQSDQTIEKLSVLQEQQIRCDIGHRIATINHRIHSTFLNTKRNNSNKSPTLQTVNNITTKKADNTRNSTNVHVFIPPKPKDPTPSSRKDEVHTSRSSCEESKVPIHNAAQEDRLKLSTKAPKPSLSILKAHSSSPSKHSPPNKVANKVKRHLPSPTREESSTSDHKDTLLQSKHNHETRIELPHRSKATKIATFPRSQNHKLHPDTLRKLFNDLDSDKDGALNRIEVCIAMHRLQLSIPTTQITAFFRRLRVHTQTIGQNAPPRLSMGTNALYEVINYKQFAALVVAVTSAQQANLKNKQQERLAAWNHAQNKAPSMTSPASINESNDFEPLPPIIDTQSRTTDTFENKPKFSDCATSPIQFPPIDTVENFNDPNDRTNSKTESVRTDHLIALILYEICCRKDTSISQSPPNETVRATPPLTRNVVERGIQTSTNMTKSEDTHNLRSEVRDAFFEFFRELRETIYDTAVERTKLRKETAMCFYSNENIHQTDPQISMDQARRGQEALEKDKVCEIPMDENAESHRQVEKVQVEDDGKALEMIDLTENFCGIERNLTVSNHSSKLSLMNLETFENEDTLKCKSDTNCPQNSDPNPFSESINFSEKRMKVIYSESSSSSSDLKFISRQSTFFLQSKNHRQTSINGRCIHNLQESTSDGEICSRKRIEKLSIGEVPSFTSGLHRRPARHQAQPQTESHQLEPGELPADVSSPNSLEPGEEIGSFMDSDESLDSLPPPAPPSISPPSSPTRH
uniref:AlNc14C41G3511 protein n=1 Tax=Albugo laibachii Nc14 TaxID=890382 RepID=F0W9Q7_9STRA|nr:AlNc14C41G3511 [Albugo laibachii Nc14]|eukprot:CCA17875.1 AlNc14C41G3511 [Albugo laibachii Nc14]